MDALDTLAPVPAMARYATWERWQADCDDYTLDLLIEPGTDLDSQFRAFDRDAGEMLRINGWLWTFERN